MSKIYKTARGRAVDLDKIKLANENTIAVGNMKVNARGDLLGPGAGVAVGRNELMDKAYAVGVDAPVQTYSPNDPAIFAAREAAIAKNQAQELFNLGANLTEPIKEEIATEEPAAPLVRGSLASAVAKTATVVQKPLPKPNKKTGPTRI
jgi:hypothetical protein